MQYNIVVCSLLYLHIPTGFRLLFTDFIIFLFQVDVRELPTIYSNQEETDTRVILYLHHAAAIGYENAVVTRGHQTQISS